MKWALVASRSGDAGWRAAAASAAAYAALAVYFARDLLRNLGTTIAGDAGDPLFVASLLHWNATRIPLTDAWWQFPIFEPTRNTLAFSEHVLGLSPISSPLHWVARDPLVTYNIVMLLTFPLCGMAMFALVHRLTRSCAAAFLAGLAFAFAPYRISHLPHLQVLGFFWAPLALLGLHAYVETGRRRWLVLYGAAWMLQGATNAYALVFLSIFVGFWVLWFVAAQRHWRALAAIGLTTIVAALPLAAVLAKYLSVHALHGFERDIGEMRTFSADLLAMLCAPSRLTFWGWLRAACRGEGELFPGVGAAAAAFVAIARVSAYREAGPRQRSLLTAASRAFVAAGALFAAAGCSVLIAGPWAFELGPIRVSASSIAKPVMLATALVLLGLVLSPGVRAGAKRASITVFYVIAALLTWVLALGPTVTFMGEARGFHAPFMLLTYLPGMSGLRVPARFWLLTTMCLAVLVGLIAAPLVQGRRRAASAGAVIAISALLLADGWVTRFPAAPLPAGVPDARALRNAAVLIVPMHSMGDIAAGYHAVTGGWRSVNGYSGYFPSYYAALIDAVAEGDEGALVPFLARDDLHVVVADDEPLKPVIERQPGAVLGVTAPGAAQYFIPRRTPASNDGVAGAIAGLKPCATCGPCATCERLRIQGLRASCGAPDVWQAADEDEGTRWHCGPQRPGQEVVIDLGDPLIVSAVVQDLGTHHASYPRHLLIETSVDGASWNAGWDGRVRSLLIAQAIEKPGRSTRIAVPLTPRQARYIRLRQLAADQDHPWSIAELEVWK